jgi:hypothetical protein
LALFYAYGYISGQWNFGRALGFLLLLLQVLLAVFVVHVVQYLAARARLLSAMGFLIFAHTVFATLLLLKLTAWTDNMLQNYRPAVSYQEISAVLSKIKAPATVLANPVLSLYLPAFGAKVVVIEGYIPFFGEQYKVRAQDVKAFFAGSSTNDLRRALLAKYQVSYILLQRSDAELKLYADLGALGAKVQAQSETFILFKTAGG